jgi:hypothetical protein
MMWRSWMRGGHSESFKIACFTAMDCWMDWVIRGDVGIVLF